MRSRSWACSTRFECDFYLRNTFNRAYFYVYRQWGLGNAHTHFCPWWNNRIDLQVLNFNDNSDQASKMSDKQCLCCVLAIYNILHWEGGGGSGEFFLDRCSQLKFLSYYVPNPLKFDRQNFPAKIWKLGNVLKRVHLVIYFSLTEDYFGQKKYKAGPLSLSNQRRCIDKIQ